MPDYKAILSGQSWNALPSLKSSKTPVFLTYTFNPDSFLAPLGWARFGSADKAVARKALKMWGDASGIRFIEVKGKEAELKFQWERSWQDLIARAEFPKLRRESFDDEGLVRDYLGELEPMGSAASERRGRVRRTQHAPCAGSSPGHVGPAHEGDDGH